MAVLTTRRLVLLPLSRAMIVERLERDDFDLRCDLPSGPAVVHFPPAWPGDPLPGFPRKLAAMAAGDDQIDGSFVAVDPGTLVAVGQLGTVGPPDGNGAQEIGYGFDPAVRGRGLATEAVVALTAHLATAPDVAEVVADTATTNVASARVLEKAGFVRTGTGWSEDDGDLVHWRFAGTPAAT